MQLMYVKENAESNIMNVVEGEDTLNNFPIVFFSFA